MNTKNQISLARKSLYGIVLIAVFLAAFGGGSLPYVQAQEGAMGVRNVSDSDEGWKTYEDPILGISIQYPQTWLVAKGHEHAPTLPGDGITFQSEVDSYDVTIVFFDNSEELSIDTLSRFLVTVAYGETENPQLSPWTVGNIPAMTIEFSQPLPEQKTLKIYSVLLLNDHLGYWFITQYEEGGSAEKANILNKMIETVVLSTPQSNFDLLPTVSEIEAIKNEEVPVSIMSTFSWPTTGYIGYIYGRNGHNGIDIWTNTSGTGNSGSKGNPIYPPYPGKVTAIYTDPRGAQQGIRVEHTALGLWTHYFHMADENTGQSYIESGLLWKSVDTNTLLGYQGNRIWNPGDLITHLHLTVANGSADSNAIDPSPYFDTKLNWSDPQHIGWMYYVEHNGGGGGSLNHPTLLSPSSGQTLTSRSVHFTWQSPNSPSQTGYTFRLNTSSNPDTQPWIVNTELGNEYSSYDYTYSSDGTYYWHMRTWNTSGQASNWVTRPFIINTSGGGGNNPPAGFTWCADEDGRCNFSGTADVVYGAQNSFTSPRSFTNGVDCNNNVFGDPIYGTRKACYYKLTSPPPSGNWHVEYFNSKDLNSRCYDSYENSTYIFKNWGTGSPASGCNSDNFSARFTSTFNFSGGSYSFHCQHDDGCKIFIDGQEKLNAWWDSSFTGHDWGGSLSGSHEVKIEFYDSGGEARLEVFWSGAGFLPTGPGCTADEWCGQYFGNKNLAGTPAVQRNEGNTNIDYTWNDGGIGYGFPTDNFSVRWQRNVYFAAGRYRFHIRVDDGGRLWVNNNLVIDQWKDQGATEYTIDLDLSVGSKPIKFEYYENGGGAIAQMWWEALQIYQPPSANFDAWPLNGTVPFTTSFHIVDMSNITSCLWDYGDGQTSATCTQLHDHIYNNGGSYTVTLTVNGPGGSDSMTRENYIEVTAPPTNDDFNAAKAINNTPYTDALDTTSATIANDDPALTWCDRAPGEASVWYAYTPPMDGQIHIDTIGSDYDTMLAVWTGTRGNLELIDCNDDRPSDLQSELNVNVYGGTTYYIEASQYNGFQAASLDSQPPKKPTIPPLEFPDSTLNKEDVGALSVGGMLQFHLTFGQADLTITGITFSLASPPAGQPLSVGVQITNQGDATSPWFSVDVYVDREPAGCWDFAYERYGFDLPPRDTTTINVPISDDLYDGLTQGTHQIWAYLDADCWVGESNDNNNQYGPVSITAGAPLPPPINDDFNTPITISSMPYSETRDTRGATYASDDPTIDACGLNPGKGSVWYKVTPSATGVYVFDTKGSDYDTVLAIWTGSRGSLASIACNDDIGWAGNDWDQDSMLSTPLTAGITYYIEVTKFGASQSAGQDVRNRNNDSIGKPSGNEISVQSGGQLQLHIVPPFLSISFTSVGSYDGWILESTETSNKGGLFNVTATTFNLGDYAADKQYRAILSFNTAGLPDNAIITKITLKIRKQGLVGTNPFNILGGLKVDIRKPFFGSSVGLLISDFQATASKSAVGTFSATPVSNWYSATIGSAGYPYINPTGTTQFRLRFQKDDNDDRGADYMKFFSGNYATASYRPTLIIEYYVPTSDSANSAGVTSPPTLEYYMP